MDFKGITGQREVIANLTDSLTKSRIGHAYIFNGPKGIGKKTVARIFAHILLCEKKNPYGSCGECLACRLSAEGTNPDFRIIRSEGASIGIDEVRKIQGDITIKPLYSDRKVYLIPDAEKMTVQAQNCLLKTFEEPPEYAVIILTASNSDMLLETIRSRAVRLNFKKNTPGEVKEFLLRKYGEKLENIDFIASYADGVIGKAIELAESEEFSELREETIRLLDKLGHSKLIDVFEAYEFFDKNRENIDKILDIMALFYRDVLAVKVAPGKDKILINSDKKDIIEKNALRYSVSRLADNIDLVEKTRRNIRQNVNFQLSMEVLLMKLREEDN